MRHYTRVMHNNGYGGLGYQASDTREFKHITAYVIQKADEAVIENYPSEASQLLNVMRSDMYRFLRILVLSNHEDNRFYNTPILKYLKPQEFCAAFFEVSSYNKAVFSHGFVERYQFADFNRILVQEFDWLTETAELLRHEAQHRVKKMSGYQIGQAAGALDKAAASVAPFRPSTEPKPAEGG